MKKLSVHLSLLCLLAFLLVPFAGCKKDDEVPADETPATTESTMESTPAEATPPATTDTMGSTDAMSTEPMATDATPPK
jgi:hypothetical protein